MPRASWIGVAGLVVALLGGCSENVGPAPPDGATRIAVRAEGPTGPRIARSGSVVEAVGGTVWVGTDAGLHRVRIDRPGDPWPSAHAGFFASDGAEAAGRVIALDVDPSGEHLFFAGKLGVLTTLGASVDGGALFVEVERPRVTDLDVDAIAVAPVSARWPAGALVAAQGREVFVRDVEGDVWSAAELGGSILRIDAVAADATRIVVGAVTPTDSTVIATRGFDDDAFTVIDVRPGSLVLDLDVDAARIAWATEAGVFDTRGTEVRWPEGPLVAAAVVATADELRWSVAIAGPAAGEARVTSGVGSQTIDSATAAVLRGGVEGIAVAGLERAWTVDAAATLSRVEGATIDGHPFAGTAAGLSTVGSIDPMAGTIAVARQRNGEVFVGAADDPDAFVSRGAQSTSTVRAIVPDPEASTRLLAASFGVYANDENQLFWDPRNAGFMPYEVFLGEQIGVITLEVLDDGAVWCGGENGEGPYRWDATASRWQRPHDGLGIPGMSAFGGIEPGLPFVTQVRDFARDADGRVWMAGFRGGAWRFDEPTWTGQNVGLPDLGGAAMDTCCVVAPRRQVDVRALERIEGGVLLAATAWGVFARGRGDERWVDRSLGLTNRDIRALAVSPRDDRTVVAVARGSAAAPDWLFLTEDAGRTWFPVGTSLVAVPAVDVVWSRPARREVVVLVEGRGAWRLELEP